MHDKYHINDTNCICQRLSFSTETDDSEKVVTPVNPGSVSPVSRMGQLKAAPGGSGTSRLFQVDKLQWACKRERHGLSSEKLSLTYNPDTGIAHKFFVGVVLEGQTATTSVID